MKKLITLLAVLVILLSFSGKAQAVPYYYTFVGEVTSLDDAAGAAASQFGLGFGIGSDVTYTFIIDFDANGYITYNDGTVVPMTAPTNYDFFYADYYSGDALVQVDGGSRNADTDRAENNYGVDIVDCPIPGAAAECGAVVGGSDNAAVQVYSPAVIASNWAVGAGDVMEGLIWASASDGTYSQIDSNLTLTDISPVSAVPEPSTLLLLASGLAGLGFFRRKSKAAIA